MRLRAVGGFETPDYEQHIHREVARLGLECAIDWTGFTRDVPAELARLDLFVLPSLFGEGLPMVVLEAMAAGIPLVATRVEGIPEAIRPGIDGLLATPGDAEALAAAIDSYLTGQADWQAIRRWVAPAAAREFFGPQSGPGSRRGVSASARAMSDRVRLFGLPIDPLTMDQAVGRIWQWIRTPKAGCRYVVTPNVDHAVLYQTHAGLRPSYADAGLVLADGMPVVWAARLLGRPLPARVTGSDLVPALFDSAAQRGGLRVFLLGAAAGVAERAALRIGQHWPAVRVFDTLSPRLGFEHSRSDNEEILARIAERGPTC